MNITKREQAVAISGDGYIQSAIKESNFLVSHSITFFLNIPHWIIFVLIRQMMIVGISCIFLFKLFHTCLIVNRIPLCSN